MRKLTTLGLAALLSAASSQAADLADKTYTELVTPTGRISLPANFRENWTHLGSWLVNDPQAPGYGFHDVYSQPEAVAAFKQTGRFPDGAVLIKEIRGIKTAKLTTGEAIWAGENKVWFVMVKDVKNRFKDNRHWGDGWGWALFDAGQTAENASKGYRESCLACHLPAKASDSVFLQGYPTLRGPSVSAEDDHVTH